jgi:SAM-dependent methyltransferase
MEHRLTEGADMTAATQARGTAGHQGRLWGSRPRDWAEIEEQQAPTYEEAIRRAGVARGQAVLELGCGSGVFLRMAADRGARVSGLDAAESLLEIASERVPEADLRVGDLQFLPYEDDSFDLVAGFNSFFFAADMTAALREARRVAKPGSPVLIQVWGRPERCDLTPMLEAVFRMRPGPQPSGPPAPPLSQPGVLEGLAAEAGLEPETAFDLSYAVEYPDEATLVRRMTAPGGVVEAIEASGVEAVTEAIVEALRPRRTPDGGYRLTNEWHYLIARA